MGMGGSRVWLDVHFQLPLSSPLMQRAETQLGLQLPFVSVRADQSADACLLVAALQTAAARLNAPDKRTGEAAFGAAVMEGPAGACACAVQ